MRIHSIFSSITPSIWLHSAQGLLVSCSIFAAVATQALTIPDTPLNIQAGAKPLIMLAMSRDHNLFTEAYNDASDIDGDGTLDIRFKPNIVYLGLFDSDLCYSHNGNLTGNGSNTGLFSPAAQASTDGLRKCTGGLWSGNWLNYVTTSRIDALRVVLYGGHRETDTASDTVLRRSYVPQDGHSWAKEYTSLAVDGYNISDYTPLSQPQTNRRHFFGNLTETSTTAVCSTSTVSANFCPGYAPRLSLVLNSTGRVWEWASKEVPPLNMQLQQSGTTTLATIPTASGISSSAEGGGISFAVRVQACTAGYRDKCKAYTSSSGTSYKPTGLLHEFGETESAFFGLVTGSYDDNQQGGRLRRVVSTFKSEVNADGTFNSAVDGIVKNINALRIWGHRLNTSPNYIGSSFSDRVANNNEHPDWGNPLAEIVYEGVRYFANSGSAAGRYTVSGTARDDNIGLSKPTWNLPYVNSTLSVSQMVKADKTVEAPWCAKANLLVISDSNNSFDSNDLPSAHWSPSAMTALTGADLISGASVSFSAVNETNAVGASEGIHGKKYFISQVDAVTDYAPTAKTVNALGQIRGLPQDPTQQGSYNVAGVARFARANDLISGVSGKQNVTSHYISLGSPNPKIEVPVPSATGTKTVVIVPMGKWLQNSYGSSSAGASTFQTNAQVVDFYVERIANSGPLDANSGINGGRYEAVFRVSLQDKEQGADHDMDAIVEYTVRRNADNSVSVIVKPIYSFTGGGRLRAGYVISGTSKDGVYLVVQNTPETGSTNGSTGPNLDPRPVNYSSTGGSAMGAYYLNVPPGRDPGYCNVTTPPADCKRLPYLGYGSIQPTPTFAYSSRSFALGTATAGSYLNEPMWYAAKWGGFTDVDNNNRPSLTKEWDADGDGQPDNFYLVQNPTKLKAALRKAIINIVERTSSASNIATNSNRLDTNSFIYHASYVSGKWTGDLKAYAITASGLANSPTWTAQGSMPSWTARNIYLNNGGSSLSNLRTTAYSAQPTDAQTEFSNANVYSYIRGDQSNEITAGGALRSRAHILGDFIHASPAFDAARGLLYIGGNDGMLHAFDATTGAEKFAFIPLQVRANLKNLSNPNYGHQYFVDGDSLLGFSLTETNNTQYLYTLLGRGGKGLFSIHPSGGGTNIPTLKWEYTPAASTGAASDPDLGYMLGRPIMALLNNGKVGLIVGNGYNSTDRKAVLYLFIINADGSLDGVKKIDTLSGGDNGLAAPAFVDMNGDGKADYVYAGDLNGNLWKFDISSSNSALWKVAYSGQPLFKSVNAGGVAQPITAAPYISKNNAAGDPNFGKYFIFFGTGSYFKAGDESNTDVQSWYGITDDQTGLAALSLAIANRSELRARSIASVGAINGTDARVFATATVGDMSGKRGWYLDLNNPAGLGERITQRSQIVPTIAPALLASSMYPTSNDACSPGGSGYLNFIDPYTGGAITLDLLDVDKNGRFDASDRLGGGFTSSIKPSVGIPTLPLFIPKGGSNSSGSASGTGLGLTNGEQRRMFDGNGESTAQSKDCAGAARVAVGGSEGIDSVSTQCNKGGELRGRVLWREIIKD